MVSCWIYGRWAAPQEYLRHVGPCKSLHLGRVGLSTKLNFVKMARWHSSTRNGCHHSPHSKGALAGHFDCHMIQDFRLKTKLAVTPKDTILERSIKINYMLARWVQQFFSPASVGKFLALEHFFCHSAWNLECVAPILTLIMSTFHNDLQLRPKLFSSRAMEKVAEARDHAVQDHLLYIA